MIGEKFIKEWQVKDKIIESIFSQFVFNHLQMTQTQEIYNSYGLENSQMDMRSMCMSEGKFPKPWQVADKIIEWFSFYNSYLTFYEWLKLKKK